MASKGVPFTQGIAEEVFEAFLLGNEISRADVASELSRALDGIRIRHWPELISIEEIDTFAQAATVSSPAVTAISKPLPLSESRVKALLAKIIGEPYVGKDWGGELNDLFSPRVVLGGKRAAASLILKGPAKPAPLTLAMLGKNGDQLDRMISQPAELFVIQHCHEVTTPVYNHLRRMIRSLRAEGKLQVVGSIWDGSDCARLFVAHRFIDPVTGAETGRAGV
jgi:hypothetical protein